MIRSRVLLVLFTNSAALVECTQHTLQLGPLSKKPLNRAGDDGNGRCAKSAHPYQLVKNNTKTHNPTQHLQRNSLLITIVLALYILSEHDARTADLQQPQPRDGAFIRIAQNQNVCVLQLRFASCVCILCIGLFDKFTCAYVLAMTERNEGRTNLHNYFERMPSFAEKHKRWTKAHVRARANRASTIYS